MDLFGRTDQELRGGLSSDAMFMSFPQLANNGLGLLITNVGLSYRQALRRIFELGPGVISAQGTLVCDVVRVSPTYYSASCSYRTQPTYYIVSRPEGRLQLARIIGPEAIQCAFYRIYGNPCGGNLMSISGQAGCSASDLRRTNMNWDMSGVVLEGVDMNASSEQMVMQESVSAMFTGLNMRVHSNVPGVSCMA